ncbi:hypothetical protein [Paraliobacillus zengyii]|nr:hypothetical protein [Paraliobacillus zengyii]
MDRNIQLTGAIVEQALLMSQLLLLVVLKGRIAEEQIVKKRVAQ